MLQQRKQKTHWGLGLKQNLAKQTAVILQQWGMTATYTKDDMMRAFRIVISTLPDGQARPIGGPSTVPWLEELVANAVKGLPTHASGDSLGLILDTLTGIEANLLTSLQKQDSFTTAIAQLQAHLQEVTTEVADLRQIIIKKRERKNTIKLPPPTPTSLPQTAKFRVTVAGILQGSQRELIVKALSGFPYPIDLTFDDATRGVTQMAKFDELIIMHWVPRQWVQKAQHLYPGNTHLATGIKHAIDLLHKIGKRCSK